MTEQTVVSASPAQAELDPAPADGIGKARQGLRSGFEIDPSVVVMGAPGTIQAESIGALRTHLLAQHVRDGRRALSICSTAQGSGSSFIAVNLACAFALAGVNTLLVDADLRSPSVQSMIVPVKPVSGLRQYLEDHTSMLHDHVQASVLPNLSVLYSGGAVPSGQELLASDRFNNAIDDSMREYEIVIADTPPSNLYADALRVAAATRYAMIVARRNHTLVSDLQTLSAALKADHAEVVGSFLNDY